MLMEGFREDADLRSGARRAGQQLSGRQGHLLGIVFRPDAVPATFLPDMLAHELVGFGIENTDVKRIALNVDELSNPAWRNAVIGRLDFDTTIQMDGALAVLVVTERFQRQWKQDRLLFRKHRVDLLLRGPVDARVRQARFP